jgi:hypothetical protein
MKRKLVANSLVAVGLLALAGLTSSAAAFASAAPAAEGARLPAEWYFAYGARYAEKALKAPPPESFHTGPSNQPHLARAGDVPVVAYVSRSEGGRSQAGWLLPALQSCSRAVSAPFRWGIEGDWSIRRTSP